MARWERVLLLGCAALGACTAVRPPGGPLPVRNQHPAQLTVLHLDPECAAPLPTGQVAMRADASYSSLFLNGSKGGNSYTMDGEYLRARLGARVGLGSGFDLGADLPVAYTTGGFLDSFVIKWHNLWNFPDQGRSDVPQDQFQVSAVANGTEAFAVRDNALELMDLPIRLKWCPLEPSPGGIGVALQASVELPTGNDQHGFGNGGVDYGTGVLFEWWPGAVALSAHYGYTIAATPAKSRAAGLDFADVSSAGIGAEVPVGGDFAALVQFEYETSTLRNLHFDRVSRDQVLLWVGGRASLSSRLQIEFAIGEDLTQDIAPDFSLFAGLSWRTGS